MSNGAQKINNSFQASRIVNRAWNHWQFSTHSLRILPKVVQGLHEIYVLEEEKIKKLIIEVKEAPGTAMKILSLYALLMIGAGTIWISELAENKIFGTSNVVVEGIVAGSEILISGLILGFVLYKAFKAINARSILRNEPYQMNDEAIDKAVKEQEKREWEFYQSESAKNLT